MDGTPLPPLPTLSLHASTSRPALDLVHITQTWLSTLESRLASRQPIADLFIAECWWRDLVALGWDFSTKSGRAAVEAYVSASTHGLTHLRCFGGEGKKWGGGGEEKKGDGGEEKKGDGGEEKKGGVGGEEKKGSGDEGEERPGLDEEEEEKPESRLDDGQDQEKPEPNNREQTHNTPKPNNQDEAAQPPPDDHPPARPALAPMLIDYAGRTWLQAGFVFRTRFGEGTGIVRLANVGAGAGTGACKENVGAGAWKENVGAGAGAWKAWIVFTQLERLEFQHALDKARMRGPADALREGSGQFVVRCEVKQDKERQKQEKQEQKQEAANDQKPLKKQEAANDQKPLKKQEHPQNQEAANTHPPEPATKEEEEEEEEVPVLIIGAGQAGLALAAHLQNLGTCPLLLDRAARLGTSWRSRYAVTLHTPTHTDHFPFLPYPSTWPRWLPRGAVATWQEHYAALLALRVELGARVESCEYDAQARVYRVRVTMSSKQRRRWVVARHVVLATGVYGDAPTVPRFRDEDSFRGVRYHSSQHDSAASRIASILNSASRTPPSKHDSRPLDATNPHYTPPPRVAVIGSGTSAHDIAQDFASHGAHVSMIQRHAIFSFSPAATSKFLYALWSLPLADADLIANSLPLALIRTMSIDITRAMSAHDAHAIAGLKRAGMALKTGEDGYGLADHQLIKGGHFYFDQGAHQMIIDGRIRILHCEEGVDRFVQDGLVLADGTEVKADIVVLATGFEHCIGNVERIMGSAVARKLQSKAFGNLDDEQERGGWWRQTGIPGFWYMTGSFMWCRQFSHFLALQIAAVEKGLDADYYARTCWPEAKQDAGVNGREQVL